MLQRVYSLVRKTNSIGLVSDKLITVMVKPISLKLVRLFVT